MDHDRTEQMIAAMVAAYPPFVRGRLQSLGLVASSGLDRAITQSVSRLEEDLRSLLARSPDEQSQSPLELVRDATTLVTEAMLEAGVRPVRRDEWESETHPEDVFGLYPASPLELGEDTLKVVLEWGRGKAAAVTGQEPPQLAPKLPGVVLFGVPMGERDAIQDEVVARGYRALLWRNPAALSEIDTERPVLAVVDTRHPAAHDAIRQLSRQRARVVATADYIDDLSRPALLALGAEEALELDRVLANLDRFLPRLV